ncbi:hypothetical protein [Achromobacter spanius]|uniref:AbiTii domain-containing protein n=1 Tax=Achromobacter spanius TaxID=217203 RepID=UPI003813C66B
MVIEDPEWGAALSRRPAGQSIGELESVCAMKDGSGVLLLYMPQARESEIMHTMDMEFQPVLHVSRAQFRGIIDAVRNIVLDWSLQLETAGILGVGMTLFREEKVRAAHTNWSGRRRTASGSSA